jgi:hypothetical protein
MTRIELVETLIVGAGGGIAAALLLQLVGIPVNAADIIGGFIGGILYGKWSRRP